MGFFFLLLFLFFLHRNDVVVKIPGGVLREGLVGTPQYINPVLAQESSDRALTRLVFGTLLHREGQDTYFDLADDLIVSPDRKKYTLVLRDDIYFHDGQKITADDVVFTLEKIQDPQTKSPLFAKWEGVKIKKIDNREIEFDLEQAYSDFEDNLNIGVLPKHLWKNIKSSEFIFSRLNQHPIGSGPYALEKIKYRKDGVPSAYFLKRFDKKAYLEEIIFFFYENIDDLEKAYQQGEIDAVYGLPPQEDFKDKNQFHLYTGKTSRIFALFLNPQKQSLFQSKEMRKLLDEMLPKQEIIAKVLHHYAFPIDNPLGEKETLKKVDRQKIVKQLDAYLTKNGWEKDVNGFYRNKKTKKYLSLSIATKNNEDLLKTAQIIKERLEGYGIKVKIQSYEAGDFHQKVIRTRDYESLLYGYLLEKPTDLYAFWHSSQRIDPGLNLSLYINRSVDTNLELLRKKGGEKYLDAISRDIQKDIPAIFIYSPQYTYLLPRNIQGVHLGKLIHQEDRFYGVRDWYQKTRRVWNFFIKKDRSGSDFGEK